MFNSLSIGTTLRFVSIISHCKFVTYRLLCGEYFSLELILHMILLTGIRLTVIGVHMKPSIQLHSSFVSFFFSGPTFLQQENIFTSHPAGSLSVDANQPVMLFWGGSDIPADHQRNRDHSFNIHQGLRKHIQQLHFIKFTLSLNEGFNQRN